MKVKFSDKSYYNLTNEAIKDLKKVYKLSLSDIEEDLQELFKRFKGVPTLGQAVRYDRLKKLQKNVLSDLNVLNKSKLKTTTKLLTDMYKDGYYHAGYDIQKQVGFVFDFDTINYPAVLEAVKNPIPDLTLPNVFGNRKTQLVRKVNLEMQQGLLRGISYFKMAENIQKRLSVDYNYAVMTAWTEGHRVLQKSRYDSLVKMEDEGLNGLKKWMSSLDARTRPTHQAADGQERKTKEYFIVGGYKLMYPGDNTAPIQETARCRCTQLYIIDGQRPLTRRVGTETIDYKNYDEWKASLPKAK